MEFIYLIFYACLIYYASYFFMLFYACIGFRMWRLTLARGGLFPLSADYPVEMCEA